ncbi:MAG: NAD-dependent dihydropyrimidine dehydrogenase subunit PreA [Clostridiaceae bacterium]|jgi:dihydropyrimidine dehydrogenase (NAD+) subunit PreA|nr:NAD-dependent dihydropyrimidine dehydrogenase subunit PreA [Clostridiaceae bacterium]
MNQNFSKAHGADLAVKFCGVDFPNPFVLGSGPETDTPEKVIRAFDRGWGGAILKTISVDPNAHTQVTPRFGAAKIESKIIGFTNMEVSSTHSLDWWAETVYKIKAEFPDRPIFASIMRTANRNEDDWIMATKMFQEAGVDGFELNFSCSHAFHAQGGGASIGKDPKATAMITKWVKSVATKPIVTKLPAITSYIGDVAKAAIDSGANGITAINSVPGIAGLDLETLDPIPSIDGFSSFTGYSGQAIRPIALRCVGEILRVVDTPIMGCGGMWDWKDCAQFILMGCSLTQLCTAPMFQGFDMVTRLIDGLGKYLAGKDMSSVNELIGLGYKKYIDHGDLSRDYHMKAKIDRSKCIDCHKCFHACQDGTMAAIDLDAENRTVISERCVGCGLCPQVCPIPGCITLKRV